MHRIALGVLGGILFLTAAGKTSMPPPNLGNENFWQSLQTDFIIPASFAEFRNNPSRGSLPPAALRPILSLKLTTSTYMDDGLAWGKYFHSSSPSCQYFMELVRRKSPLLETTLSSQESVRMAGTDLKAWIDKCESEALYPALLRSFRVYGILGLNYNFEEFRGFQGLRLRFRNTTQLRATLGLKSNKKLPLIIFRTGIFSNAGNQHAERFLIQHFFDASPFHILILPSTRGSDFSQDNPGSPVGVDVEAQQLEEILTWLKDPKIKLSHLVSDVHLLGASLGNQGMIRFLARHPEAKDENSSYKKVSSFAAICPVLNFKAAIEPKLENFLERFFVGLWANYRLEEFTIANGLPAETSAIEAVYNHFSKIPDFWSRHEMGADLTKVTVPSWIFLSKDDPLIPFASNFRQIEFAKTPQSMNLFTLKNAGHCYFPAHYKRNDLLDAISTMQRASSGWRPTRILADQENLEIESIEVETDPQHNTLWNLKITLAPGHTLQLPKTATPYGDLEGPLSGLEEEMVQRWAARNLFSVGRDLYATGL